MGKIMKNHKVLCGLALSTLIISGIVSAQCDSYVLRIVNYTDKTCRLMSEKLLNGGIYENLYMSSQLGPKPILKPEEESIFSVAHKILSSSGVALTYDCGNKSVSINTHLSYDSPIWAGTLTASVQNDNPGLFSDYRILSQPSCLNESYAMVNWNIRE